MRSRLDETVFVPVRAIRPYLVLKGTMLLLAFDMWITRIPHAGRYGAGRFNVSHFPMLDAVQPVLSPGLYLGTCVLTGVLAMAAGIATRPPRALIALICVLHTWSWAMSMFDSYQHHYLLSLALFLLVFFPSLSADQALVASPVPEVNDEAPKGTTKAKRTKKMRVAARVVAKPPETVALSTRLRARLAAPSPMVASAAYFTMAISFAIVYAYTAYSKSDPEWLTGAPLIRLLHLPPSGDVIPGHLDPVGPVRALLGWFGLEGPRFWWFMGHSVVVVQIVCAAGYILAPFRDMVRSRAIRLFSYLALFTSLSFHLGAEYMGLQIGWFSWYMVGYALIFMVPGGLLVTVCRGLIPTERTLRPEVLIAPIAVAGLLLFLGLTAPVWSRGVLAQVFGSGVNVPLAMLGIALLFLTPIRLISHGVDVDTRSNRMTALAASTGLGLLWLVACTIVDLPGAAIAGGLFAVGLGGFMVVGLVRREDARAVYPYGVAAGVAAISFWLSIVLTDVRWDFYRNLGGDTLRRQDFAASVDAYEHANAYAPEGENRNEKLEIARDALRRLREGARR